MVLDYCSVPKQQQGNYILSLTWHRLIFSYTYYDMPSLILFHAYLIIIISD